MNNELKITIITCAILFSGIGILVSNTINSDNQTSDSISTSNSMTNPNEINEKQITKPNTTISKLDSETLVKKIELPFYVSPDNEVPFATIKGTVENAVSGHPIIIQIYKPMKDIPVHVAQIRLNPDNSYEYKFRVFAINDGETIKYFEGNYIVKVFTVVTK